jgi:cytochrome P450
MKVFTPRAVGALAPRVEALVEELLASAERGSMEEIADLAYPLPATVICELLGIPAADRERNRAWAAVTAQTIDPMCTDVQIKAASQAMAEWDVYIRALLAERRRNRGEALLDALLAVEEDGTSLTEDEVAIGELDLAEHFRSRRMTARSPIEAS